MGVVLPFILWLLIGLCDAGRRKDMSVLAAIRDTIELSNSENPGSVTGSTLSQAQKDAVLQLHNAFRSMVKPSASNMLRMMWDEDLEKISTDFANKCIVAHNPDRHKLAKNYDWVGENIAWGTGTCGDKECGDVYEGVKRWFTENKSYNFLTGQCSGKCTLYTQMVWWESNKLGCGAKRCGDRTILVCNYAPGGNYVGQRPYKTGKPCKECPTGLVCEDNLCTETKKADTVEEKKETSNKKEESVTKEDECPGGVAKKQDTSSGIPVFLCPQSLLSLPLPPVISVVTTIQPYTDHNLPSGWKELTDRLTQVDSGITPNMWGIDAAHDLYYYNTVDNKMTKLNVGSEQVANRQKMHHVSAGQAGVWGIGLLGNVWFLRCVDQVNDCTTRENLEQASWEKIPGNLKQIDSGATGTVWGVNRFDRVFCRIGIDNARPEGAGWMRVEGNMKYVSCGEYGCWAVNKRDNIYFRTKITETHPQGDQWLVVPGKLRMVESGPAGLTVGLSAGDDLFVRQGVTPAKPEGIRWAKLDLKLAHVAVGDKGIIGILRDGTVAIHSDINSFVYQTPTIPPTDSGLIPSQATPLDGVTTMRRPTTSVPVNENPVTSQTLEGSLESLQQLNPSLPVSLGSLTEKDQLHISPDMASKILKLIEQKGNQFEDAHKAAAAAAALSRNSTANALISQKSDETPVAPPILPPGQPSEIKNSTSDAALKPISPSSAALEETNPAADTPTPEIKATSQENNQLPLEIKSQAENEEKSAESAEPTPAPQLAESSKESKPPSPHPPTTVAATALPRTRTSPRTTIKPPTSRPPQPVPSSNPVYPNPRLPTPAQRAKTTHPKTTVPALNLLITKTHSNLMHRLPTAMPLESKIPSDAKLEAALAPPPPQAPLVSLPPQLSAPAVPPPEKAPLPPPVPLGQRVVAHSGAQVPTTAAPTVINASQKHTFAAPHAFPAPPTLAPLHVKKTPAPVVPNTKKLDIHKGVEHPQQLQPVLLRPATVSLQMTRSCCAIPDSVCPIPKDCIGYIECHGYHGNYKSCDRGKMFNPITNICDYPRNVDCESVKASDNNKVQTKNASLILSTPSTTVTTTTVVNTTAAAETMVSTTITTSTPPIVEISTTPTTTPVMQESTSVNLQPAPVAKAAAPSNDATYAVVPSHIAPSATPQFEPPQHMSAAHRDETSKLDLKQTSVQPRVNRPHTDDDGVLREVWFGLGLSPLLTLLTNNPRFPTNPDEYIVLDKFEAPPNAGDGYGQRLSTYFKAPETGEYVFYISCDNECELWISPDTEEIHSNLILEMKHGHYTSFRQWHKYPTEQTSRPIFLQENEYYFMESFMKEGAGGDDLSIGVKMPNGEFDLPISKNLYLVPGDTSTGLLTRKVGQSVLLPQTDETVLKTPQVVQSAPQIPQQTSQEQMTQQQMPQQQGQVIQAQAPQIPTTGNGNAISANQIAQSFSQPVPVMQSVSLVNPIDASSMGPQPGQTAEQWVAENNKPNSESNLNDVGYQSNKPYVSVANKPFNIPGAEMYSHHDIKGDLETFEQNNQHYRSSVKRDYIQHGNHSAIR